MSDWRHRAACISEDEDLFTGDQVTELQVALAQSVCDRCPVRQECDDLRRDVQRDHHQAHGMWAGQWYGPKPTKVARIDRQCSTAGCENRRMRDAAEWCRSCYNKHLAASGRSTRRNAQMLEDWAAMRAQGLTDDQVAERLGVTRSALHKARARARESARRSA